MGEYRPALGRRPQRGRNGATRRAGAAALCLATLGALCAACAGPPAGPDLARPGPYPVGVTTLDLGSAGPFGERDATVFYPADASRIAGHERFSYELGAPLPRALVAIVPPKYNSTISVDASVGAPGSGAGPFPIVLFSHGFGASRLYYSHLLAGIASWGFVVVSADYLERGLLVQATHATVVDTPALDLHTMLASLSATEAASSDPSSPLHHLADGQEVAAVGHSAGGQTAFDALADPRVKTAVGWAPVGPSGPPSHKPVLIIGEQQDVALTPAILTGEFDRFPGPATLVEISGEGHNSYTDLCPSIRSGGGGLVGFALSLHLISGALGKLAVNGCTARNLPAPDFWPVVQDYTVAALRHGLGLDHQPPPAPPGPHQFPQFTITFRQHG